MKELLQQTYGFIFEDKLIDEIENSSILKDFKYGTRSIMPAKSPMPSPFKSAKLRG